MFCVSRLCAPGIDHPGDHRSVCHPLPSQESLQGKRVRLLVTFLRDRSTFTTMMVLGTQFIFSSALQLHNKPHNRCQIVDVQCHARLLFPFHVVSLSHTLLLVLSYKRIIIKNNVGSLWYAQVL